MVLRYRGHRLVAEVSISGVTLTVDPGPGAPITVRCFGRTRQLKAGESQMWTSS